MNGWPARLPVRPRAGRALAVRPCGRTLLT
jgi:hypothetical protein